jgi:flagellar biosynthetic protein FlhB
MAEDDKEQRTEEPTGKKLEEAADKGQVAYSQELSQAVLLLSGLGLLSATGGALLLALQDAMRSGLTVARLGELDVHAAEAQVLSMVGRVAPAAFPMLAGLLVSAALIGFAQAGFRLRSETMGFQLERINPATGWRRLLSVRSLIQLASALIKISIILGIVYASSGDLVARIQVLARASVHASAGAAISLGFALLLRIGVATLLVGGADYLYQRWQHHRDLRMTKEEVKEETRQQQGDPAIKARIRRAQRIAAQRRMLRDVPKSTVVITNPTHYAIAVRYRRAGGLEEADAAPLVLAKGKDLMAKRIREIAEQSRVPIVENPPLARALYSTTEVGMWIPADLYKAVAEVLAFVFRLQGAAARR